MFRKLTLLVSTALLLSACQANLATPSSPTLSLSEKEATPTPSVSPTPTPDNQLLLNRQPNQNMYATLKTSLGSIRVQLFPDKAPNTVANFVGLAEGTKAWTDPKTGTKQTGKSLYAGTVFHRIIKGFMIQGGDPLGNGLGGPGYRFADELIGEQYTKGTLAMANSGPNTNGSQFFVMHADYSLPPNYTVFGRIDASDSASFATLDQIASVPVTDNGLGENSKPTQTVILEAVTIDRQ